MQKGRLFQVHSMNVPVCPKLARLLLELLPPLCFEAGYSPEIGDTSCSDYQI